MARWGGQHSGTKQGPGSRGHGRVELEVPASRLFAGTGLGTRSAQARRGHRFVSLLGLTSQIRSWRNRGME